MSMKQLRLAAERIAIRAARPGDSDLCAQHILATVPADDDDPVTVEKILSQTKPMPAEDPQRYWLNKRVFLYFDEYGRCTLCTPDLDPAAWHEVCDIRTMGQLRHLLAGLGMGGGECQ